MSALDRVLEFYTQNVGENFTDEEIKNVMGFNTRSYVSDIRRRLKKKGHNFTTKLIQSSKPQIQVFGYLNRNADGEPGRLISIDGYENPVKDEELIKLQSRMWGEMNTRLISAILKFNSRRYWTHDDVTGEFNDVPGSVPQMIISLASNHGVVLHRRVIGHRRYEYRVTSVVEREKSTGKKQISPESKSLLTKVFS